MKKKTEIIPEAENTEVFVRTQPEKKKEFKKPSKKKIFIILGAILVLVVAAGVYFSSSKPEPGLPVSTGVIERADIVEDVSIKGTIEGSESADVASTLNYKITAINVKEGDLVKAGQVIATLDVQDLRDQYSKAQLALNESKRALATAETLYGEGAMSQDEYLKLKAAYENDRLTLSSIDIADKQNIKSPIDGTVTRVNVNIGRYASETENNQPMFVVENLKDLQMKVKISEYDISKIKVGQTVEITAEVLGGQSVTGVVSNISPTGENKDGQSTEKVIPVTINVDKGDTNLIAGVTAKATILIEKRENVLTIPIDSVLEDPETGETSVFTVTAEGTLKKVPVELGLEGTLSTEVLGDSLKEGDEVVLAPTLDMQDGMQVIVNQGM